MSMVLLHLPIKCLTLPQQSKERMQSLEEFIKMYTVLHSVIMDYLWQIIEINCCFAGAQYKQNIWVLREKLQCDFIGCYLVSVTNISNSVIEEFDWNIK